MWDFFEVNMVTLIHFENFYHQSP